MPHANLKTIYVTANHEKLRRLAYVGRFSMGEVVAA